MNALLLIDFINDIVDPAGKLAGKGYADFAARHGTLKRVSALLTHVRRSGWPVIHVRIGFSPDYKEQPKASPLFGHADKLGALRLGEWGTEFHAEAAPLAGEAILVKHRVNAFVGTPLDILLKTAGVKHLAIAGVSTDVGVQTTARAAHDLDYACTVVGDCCMAPNDADHEQTLRMLVKVAKVTTLEELAAHRADR
jgi:nicotinamidase-related amidase